MLTRIVLTNCPVIVFLTTFASKDNAKATPVPIEVSFVTVLCVFFVNLQSDVLEAAPLTALVSSTPSVSQTKH